MESLFQEQQSTQPLKLVIYQQIILFLVLLIKDTKDKMVIYLIFIILKSWG